MMVTIFKMTSLISSKLCTKPLAGLPTIKILIPIKIAKKIIDNISPFAIALMGLDGIMLENTSSRGGADCASNAASVSISMPLPIPNSTPRPIAVAIASAVVII